MKFAVLYSKKDEAGKNIAEQLKNFYIPQSPVIEMQKESIYNEQIDKKLPELNNAEFLIFATKHQSKEGKPSLSLHAPGNWRSADFGGKIGKVCPTSALVLKFLFQKLNENAANQEIRHNITIEVTHHGPLVSKPCCFIEIGSNEQDWKNQELGKIIAKTIFDFQDFEKWKDENKIKIAIGIGGLHYCPNFNKIQLSQNSNIAISHIIPEYALPLTENMLKETLSKTKENVDVVLLDWKGCGNSESRQKIIEMLDQAGLKHERTERIEK